MYQNRRFFIRYLIGLLLFGFNGIVASHIALSTIIFLTVLILLLITNFAPKRKKH